MSVAAMAMGASAAMATDETQTAQALIGDFTPGMPEAGALVVEAPVNRADSEPTPELTAQIALLRSIYQMQDAVDGRRSSMSEIYRKILNEYIRTLVPPSKETIAAARAKYKALAKAGQQDVKLIQIQAAAELRSLGANAEQLKALSSAAKWLNLVCKDSAKASGDITAELSEL